MPSRPLSCLLVGCLLVALAGPGRAQANPGIYTCIDAKGRRLTSDRPITDCLDREQKELNANGTVRRTLPPALTAVERAAQEDKERRIAEERQRQADEKRAQKALLARYPDQATHDAEREKALRAVAEVVDAGQRRIVDLQDQRKKLLTETEFYKDASKWPHKLKRQIDDIDQQIAGQQRFVVAQEEEKMRINTRFDEELVRLKALWAQNAAATAAAAAAASSTRKN